MMTLAVSSTSRATGEKFAVHNPYDNSKVAELTAATPQDIHHAVQLAKKAADAFRFSTPFERRDLLNRIANLLERDADKVADLICLEVGKTIHEARNEARRAQNTLRLSGDAATFVDGEVLHCGIVAGGVDRQATVTYVPTGVVGAITPFNYPVNLLCHKLGPAIAAGNAIIVKPSPKAPLGAQHFIELCEEAGAPKGLIQVVHGGAEAALALAKSDIDLLSFTGGPAAGLALKNASGLVRCLMELGGNDPLIVMPDADLKAAAETAIGHRFEIAGQSCAAVKKLYVHEDIQKEFTEILQPLVAGVKTGDPMDLSTVMGPVIDEMAAQDIMNRLDDAQKHGAKLLCGGTREAAMVAPTLIENISPEAELFKSETFGPVLAMRAFSDIDATVRELNESGFGLQAGLYTNDHSVIRKVSRALQVGGIMVNEGPDFRAEHVPFGGVKKSGLGREGVRITIREMSETRVVID